MNENTLPAVAAVATRVHPAVRWTTSLLWITLGVVLGLLVALAFAAWFVGAGIFMGCVAALAAGASVIAVRNLPCGNVARLATSYACLAGVLFYLAHDDRAVREPARIEPAVPGFPGAAESYAVLMRYGKQQPLGRDFRLPTSPALQQGGSRWKPADPGWQAWLIANRAEIERSWATLEPVRAWWTEVNAFDRLGDLTPPKADADILAFQPVRAVFQHACAIASLHAIDGDAAAAIATLVPVLEVSRKLQPSSRTLVRSMIGIVGEKLALETAAFVLSTTAVPLEERRRLATALRGGVNAEEGARRLVTIEYEWAAGFLNDPMTRDFPVYTTFPPWMHHGIPHFARIIYNPRRTLNRYCDMMIEMQRRAIRRGAPDIDAVAATSLQAPLFGYKNFAGAALLRDITPRYNKVLESYWKSEQLRTTLQQRLQS